MFKKEWLKKIRILILTLVFAGLLPTSVFSKWSPYNYGAITKRTTMRNVVKFLFENGVYYNDESQNYRTGKYDPYAIKVPKRIKWNFFDNMPKGVSALAAYLSKGTKNDFHKAKRVHDFLTYNLYYDMDEYKKRMPLPHTNKEIQRRQRGVCGWYARCFELIAREIGLKVYRVSGVVKATGQPHAWNAVYIKSNVYIIDSTWDSSNIYELGKFTKVKKYKQDHLFMRPEARFIFAWADQPSQFMDKHLPKYEFSGSKYTLNAVKLGVDINAKKSSHYPGGKPVPEDRPRITSEGSFNLIAVYATKEMPVTFTLSTRNSTTRLRALVYDSSRKYLKRVASTKKQGKLTTVSFNPPSFKYDKNKPEKIYDRYKCIIQARDISKGRKWKNIYTFVIQVEEAEKKVEPSNSGKLKTLVMKKDEFILTADTQGSVVQNISGYYWTKIKGKKYTSKYWTYNYDTVANSTIAYSVKLPSAGRYEFYVLAPSKGFKSADVYVVADGERMVLTPTFKGGEWRICTKDLFGRTENRKKIIEIKNPNVKIIAGNGYFTDARRYKVSFEALKIKKVSN